MKVGIIGCGGMGKVHAAALAALRNTLDIDVVALADEDPERRRQAGSFWPGAVPYAGGESLLEHPGLDAVHICVPTYLHRQYAVAAMRQGLHVFIEKPVCLTSQDEKDLLEAQEQTGVKVMVGQVVRFFPEYVFLKEVYDSGRYGVLKSLVMHRLSPRPVWGWQDWFEAPEKSGTVFFDLHIHDADFARYLLGEPDSVRVEGCLGGSDQPVQQVTTYDYGRDLLVVAEGNWDNTAAFPFQMGFRANFEDATLVFDSTRQPSLAVYSADGTEYPLADKAPQGSEVTEGVNVDTIGPYITEIETFARSVLEDTPIHQCTLEDAIESVRLVRKEMETLERNL